MARQDYDLPAHPVRREGGGATFYAPEMEHSRYKHDGTGWERTPWHAVQRAAWEALNKVESGRMS